MAELYTILMCSSCRNEKEREGEREGERGGGIETSAANYETVKIRHVIYISVIVTKNK